MTRNPDPMDPRDEFGQSVQEQAAKKKRKRRKWPWVLVGLVVLLLLLVLLAPTLISMGPMRAFIASQAGNYINGSVRIDDLSLGWTSGTRVGGVKIYDDKGVLILELNQLQTQLSLLDAIRGKYELGETLVDANLTKCTVYEDGSTNYQHLAKKTPGPEQPTEKSKPGEPSKLPDVSGNITMKYRGTIDGPGVPQPIIIDPSTAVVKISNINQPIENDLKLAYRLGSAPPASVSFAGTIDAIEQNEVLKDPTQFVADQKLALENVNLAAAKPFVQSKEPTTQPMDIGGIANGSVMLKADGKKSAAADGTITVANLLFGGGPLGADTYKSAKLNVPINVTATALDLDNTLIKIQKLLVETDHATLTVSGQVTQQALTNVAANKKPGAAGNLAVVVDVPKVGELANQLPNTLKLQQGVKIEQGVVKSSTNVEFKPDSIAVVQTAHLEAAGQNNGKPVKLDAVELKNLSATLVPTGQAMPDIRSLALELISPFITAKTTGPDQSLSNLAIAGDLNLDKAYQQLVQFSDLGGMKMAGTGTFAVSTKGDLLKPKGTAQASADLNLKNVVVSGLKDRPDVNQPNFVTHASATLLRAGEGSNQFLESVRDVTITTLAGEQQSPVLDLEAKIAAVSLDTMKATNAQVTKLNIPDLAKAQQQFGGRLRHRHR